MAPTAIALGLRPTHPEERVRTPHRTRVVDVILEDKTLPPGVVYVGRGHHSHRLPITKWSSPFVPGRNCDPSSWLPLYVEHIMQHLAGDLPELTGCILACDCEMHMVCEGDALAGLVFESDARQLGPRRSGRLVHPGRYAGCWPRWPLSRLRWAQLSRIGRKRRSWLRFARFTLRAISRTSAFLWWRTW